MNYLLLIFFGLAPSIIWLLYFLRKDVHPEDNRQVLKIFIYGFLTVAPAALIQLGICRTLDLCRLEEALKDSFWQALAILFFGVVLVEEFFKYLVVRDKVLASSHFDEPTDLPLYLIISALGFAAAENLLVIMAPNPWLISPTRTVVVSVARSLSAIFLHALASGTLGIFLALAYFQPKSGRKLTILGFTLAVGLHGLYNFSIMVIENELRFFLPLLILINLALVLSLGFNKLRELKSICEINPKPEIRNSK